MGSGWIALARLNRCKTISLEIMRSLPWEYRHGNTKGLGRDLAGLLRAKKPVEHSN